MAVLLEDIVKSVEELLKLISKKSQEQSYVDPNLDPVLLVPGIAGSILNSVNDKTGKKERIWVRILAADHEFREKLWSKFDPATGRAMTLDPDTHIEVPEDRDGLYAIDTLDPDMVIGGDCVYYFHDMIVEMLKWGYQEGTTLFGFGYDFRQSNRFQGTLERLAAKLESVYTASGGRKINIITHSMGGLLIKCFMSLYVDIFEKYVKNWIAIAAPFRGAPGYIGSALLNGTSFVQGWEQNFFISKWSMQQLLLECPSIYELMACLDFKWEHVPLLQIWRHKCDGDGNSTVNLESFPPVEAASVFMEALSVNKAKYINVDGDGTVPMESAKADGLRAEARIGVHGDHRGIICDRHVFRILKHWLKADHDPFYNPINDYVILPSALDMEFHKIKGLQVTSLKEEWEIIGDNQNLKEESGERKPLVGSVCVSRTGVDESLQEEAFATIIVQNQQGGKKHVELNAVSISMDA
ncbi:lecithin-cholesterol acyltransferase-like 4 isoform X2 [Primulina eburnea]|uniref:lecithin-cholesterol acyltransferase-like 4 isoform X2 n=1 Tax=Primulina eburnea TaxID=1245227 RepID=UPI003C6C07B3